ncbi:rSAM-associated Gly-rich repeat protein [Terrimicrobium sacchariphilum]|jgi:rSAM-associated Gly-rich repeat protein|uniref:RSAM-associated Gly-rich repeat protein n=1 Tax=Terrimicrobium sacchariphilum TaxID=690879 RepID=A0A146G9H0_TERSA|nr:GrrA/OscA1 family cyclophane-containing rSAM-modified RiPP [Terrimicrobium sacchariphilum]GAT34319.1 rSAM-associated Gly-rich repeat protein [Terrimicrobium sacchariphilum]
MKNTSLKQSLPALIAVTGGALAAGAASAEAAQSAVRPSTATNETALETRISNVQDKLNGKPGVTFAERSMETPEGLQTFWWGNWHNGGFGPGAWHNWGNGGWHNWGNGWGNGGWHNWHNWGNF